MPLQRSEHRPRLLTELTVRLLAEQVLAERLLTEQLLTKRLLAERLLTKWLLAERLLTELTKWLLAERLLTELTVRLLAERLLTERRLPVLSGEIAEQSLRHETADLLMHLLTAERRPDRQTGLPHETLLPLEVTELPLTELSLEIAGLSVHEGLPLRVAEQTLRPEWRCADSRLTEVRGRVEHHS